MGIKFNLLQDPQFSIKKGKTVGFPPLTDIVIITGLVPFRYTLIN